MVLKEGVAFVLRVEV